MAFSDPQSLTVNAVAKSCVLIERVGQRSRYATSDGAYTFKVSHQNAQKSRIRSMARFDKRIVAADPLSSINEYKDGGVYIVLDRPVNGFTSDELVDIAQALMAWATEANLLKLLAGES